MDKGILESQNGKAYTGISELKKVFLESRNGKRNEKRKFNIVQTRSTSKNMFLMDFNKQHLGSVPILKWKNNRVPYEISENMPPKLKAVILDTIQAWNKDFSKCIPWLPRKKERDYVYFTDGSYCHSEVGRMKRKQLLVLNGANCNDTGSVLHEMMHAIGFTHEHNRPDRDDYIEMLFLNIPYEWRKQYAKESLNIMEKLGPYDYYSLMHYEMQSPDRNKPAFRVIKEGVDLTRIGQRKSLTEIDKSKVKALYCPFF
ncbi:zinc metalloproteinase nas-7 [Caerostris darwini]|uniref:Metalloendopeptidase n=1 Tax=Caerostris darwini TaxID=1538125 RepID=A0AAV4U638_9ARAC|nr:zinc metalloproteinase nas-7 [Caerostris darwini]